MIELITRIVFYGISLGFILALLSLGFSLMLGFMRIINILYGLIYTFGAYLIFYLYQVYGFNYLTSLVILLVFGGIVGIFTERAILRRLYGKDLTFTLLLTYSFLLMLTGLLKLIAGIDPKPARDPFGFMFTIPIINVELSFYRLFCMFVGIPVYFALWYIFTRTIIGKIVMAGVDDFQGLLMIGISPKRAFLITMLIGSAIAALGGALHAPMVLVQPYMSFDIILYVIAIVAIGGVANLKGTLLASLFVGFLIVAASYIYPALATVIPFICLVIFTYLRG